MSADARARDTTAVGVWVPTPDYVERSRLLNFCRSVGVSNRKDLAELAQRDPRHFWDQVQMWLNLPWQHPPSVVADQLEVPESTRWFVDGYFNVYDATITKWVDHGRGDDAALRWEDESGETGQLTFNEAAASIEALAWALADAGLSKGDLVGIQLPMRVEAALAQLALAKLGVISVPIFSGFGHQAVRDRLVQSGAKALIVADGVVRRGKYVALRDQVRAVIQECPDVELCITVSSPQTPTPTERLRGERTWTELIGAGLGRTIPTARCQADQPLMIAYTSGTTGQPKGVTLSHVGFCVKSAFDAAMLFDLGTSDVACWITDPGWVMSPITLLGGLASGATVALLDGAPDFPDNQRIWRAVDTLGVTMLGVSPTLIRTLMAQQSAPESAMPSLRVMASSGEPWTLDAYTWLFSQVGKGHIPIINYSGGTEVSGAILSNTVVEEIRPGAFAGPVPGMGADVVDPQGRSIEFGVGELALRLPSPGMPLDFWGEPGRYQASYWREWPNVWRHGDWVEIATTGEWYIHGRSDDTLKVAGKRIGPSEVENVVNQHPDVIESAAIGVPDPIKGEALVVFVRLDKAVDDENAVRSDLELAVMNELGKPLKPAAVLFVDDLPRTRSGKILRRMVRDVHLGHEIGHTSSLDNPGSLQFVRSPR